MSSGTLKVFFSYAHEDEDFVVNLQKHLMPLRHERVIEFWYDRDIEAGQGWDDEISGQLEQADMVVVLVSADLIASEYAYGKELRRALALQEERQLRVLPVIARNCRWQNLPIAKLQALPKSGKPITDWPNRDDGYVSAAVGIEEVARQLLATSSSLVNEWLTYRLMRRRVIRFVQRQLVGLGFYDGPIDGVPGPGTERALVDFQRERGLTVDAKIGPQVIQSLEKDPGRAAADDRRRSR